MDSKKVIEGGEVKEPVTPTATSENVTPTTSEEAAKNADETPAETPSSGNSTETKVETKEPEKNDEPEPEEAVEYDPRNDDMHLKYIDKDLVYDVMSVPTVSSHEYRFIEFLILWCRRNKVKYEFDSYGNFYITKGEVKEGEFYPCVTSHLDTVQKEHEEYLRVGVPLDLKTEVMTDGKHKISVDSLNGRKIGIGADCKGGVAICLALIQKFDAIKACFFLEEEMGMLGSDKLEVEWFNDVGYVIGYDSPDLHRAAVSVSSVKLFNYAFYEKYMKEICDEFKLVKGCFRQEPITDVKKIREKTGIICMNFGNGGYNAHSSTEYSVVEDMDHACGMGMKLIEKIGRTQHIDKSTSMTYGGGSYTRQADGTYKNENEEDLNKLKGLCETRSYTSSYGGGSSYPPYTRPTAPTKEEQLKMEMLKYVVHRYDSHISNLKEDLLSKFKDMFSKDEDAKEQYAKLEGIVNEVFSTDIKF